jgi:hypothetical protein
MKNMSLAAVTLNLHQGDRHDLHLRSPVIRNAKEENRAFLSFSHNAN